MIETIAGNGVAGYSGDGGAAILCELDNPDYLVFDHATNIYIADEHNHVVRKVNTSGIITTIAGNGFGAGLSDGGYSGDNGPATAAMLSRPSTVGIDRAGNIYITEFGNNTIRKVTPSGIISTIAGTGIAGYSGDNGPATHAMLNDPLGLAFDSIGNLYFSDNSNRRIRKIDVTTGIITTIAGTGTAGYSGDNGPATAAEMRISGYLAFSPTGELYIPEYYNHVIRKIDHSGVITTIAGTGTSGYTGDNGPATAAKLVSVFSIIFDSLGNMYLSDRVIGVIRKINTSGIITTIAGIGSVGYGGDNGPATAAQFNTDVNCSAIDAYGNLYIADPNNNRIRRIVFDETAVNNVYKQANKISIYPNPAQNEVTIKSTTAIASVEVVNMMGQVVVAPFGKASGQAASSKEVLLDIRSLPAGVYFVKVNGPDGYRDGGRFLKE